VHERFGRAVAADGEPHAADPASLTPGAQLIDVRRAATYAEAPDILAGATWRDPARLADWSGELDASQPILVYCFHGLDIGRSAALSLRARGFDARYIAGGIERCRSLGMALAPKG
jgi:Fe-Mn family superoxide dismutase